MARNPRHDSISDFMAYGVDLTSKTLYLGFGEESEYDLDAVLARNIIKGLHILRDIRPADPIKMIINNQGGETQHGLAIYDAILELKDTPVHGIVKGHCYSIAAWVIQACDLRLMTRSSSMMIHDGDGSISGNADDTRNWFRFQQEQDTYCREILLRRIREKHPTYTMGKLEKLLKNDTLYWPSQAMEMGLIDGILE